MLQHLRALQALGAELVTAAEPADIARVVTAGLQRLLAADRCSVALEAPAGLRLFDSDEVVDLHAPLPICIAARTGDLVIADSRAAIAAPIRGDAGARGALGVELHERVFGEEDAQLVLDVANLAALAMSRAIAAQRAVTAERRKDEFLAMLGHELRNPLAPIMIAAELVDVTTDQGQEARDLIARQAKHMARLVDDLLDASRMAGERLELERVPVALASVLGRSIAEARPHLADKGQQVRTDLAADVWLHGDPTRLTQVFANLLGNASKYSSAEASIEVCAQVVGDDVVVTIRDDGQGIAPELLPHVFDAFAQAPQDAARARGGLGLGLAIVKQLVELHGGTVCARSEGQGRGSELEVRLPVWRGTPRALHVLVVDDNVDAARTLAAGLASRGFTTHHAHDGASALHVAASVVPDVALIDIGLPVMDGYQLCQRLAELPVPPRVCLAVTGYGQAADRQRALAAGFADHLVKPVDLDAIVCAILGARQT